MSTFTNIYKKLIIVEGNSRKIGLFITLSAIFGGLLVAYLGMTLLTLIIPDTAANAIILPLLFNTFVWSCTALWITVSPTKMSAILRFTIPSIIFSLLIYILY